MKRKGGRRKGEGPSTSLGVSENSTGAVSPGAWEEGARRMGWRGGQGTVPEALGARTLNQQGQRSPRP